MAKIGRGEYRQGSSNKSNNAYNVARGAHYFKQQRQHNLIGVLFLLRDAPVAVVGLYKEKTP